MNSVFIEWILIIYKFDIFGNEAMDLEKIYRESLVLFFEIFPSPSWCIISLYIFFNFYMIFLKDLNFIKSMDKIVYCYMISDSYLFPIFCSIFSFFFLKRIVIWKGRWVTSSIGNILLVYWFSIILSGITILF